MQPSRETRPSSQPFDGEPANALVRQVSEVVDGSYNSGPSASNIYIPADTVLGLHGATLLGGEPVHIPAEYRDDQDQKPKPQ